MSKDGDNGANAKSGHRPLVSVERQVEYDLSTGERQERRFVKMYFEARESGLLADIPDDLWKTLCALATYVDDQSYCFPSQETIGRDLGISRQAANGRLKRLREYRFKGRPVIEVRRERVRSEKGQTRWGKNVYRLLPLTGFFVGRGSPEDEPSMSGQADIESEASMSRQPDIEEGAGITSDSPAADFSMSGSMSSRGDINKREQEDLEEHTHHLRRGVCLEKGRGIRKSSFGSFTRSLGTRREGVGSPESSSRQRSSSHGLEGKQHDSSLSTPSLRPRRPSSR